MPFFSFFTSPKWNCDSFDSVRYNGNVTTTLHSLKAGGDGYGGVSANFYPWVHAWLCANWEKQPEAAIKVQRFLTVAEMVVKTMYPNSAKVYLGTRVTSMTRLHFGFR